MRELALFAGAGGGLLGSHLLGWRTVCAVEINPYCREVLKARQDDKTLQPFPIWDDVCTFDGLPWRGLVDVVSGGFPCQDISIAGAGLAGERSGLWSEFARIIRDVRPRFVFVENSPMLVSRGLGQVLGDLAAMGYDAEWGVLGAADAGAPHKRDRIWILAYSDCLRELQPQGSLCHLRRWFGNGSPGALGDTSSAGLPNWSSESLGQPEEKPECQRSSGQALGDTMRSRCQEHDLSSLAGESGQHSGQSDSWWSRDPGDDAESGVARMAHGMANRVDRVKALGNGQVPIVAALAVLTLTNQGQS
jgi:DNA (cytosine-5)-methyltransferase 1